jgi:hypothetical protein
MYTEEVYSLLLLWNIDHKWNAFYLTSTVSICTGSLNQLDLPFSFQVLNNLIFCFCWYFHSTMLTPVLILPNCNCPLGLVVGDHSSWRNFLVLWLDKLIHREQFTVMVMEVYYACSKGLFQFGSTGENGTVFVNLTVPVYPGFMQVGSSFYRRQYCYINGFIIKIHGVPSGLWRSFSRDYRVGFFLWPPQFSYGLLPYFETAQSGLPSTNSHWVYALSYKDSENHWF